MPNRENRGYNGIDVLEKGFSGQHNRQEVRELRPSERSSQKNIPEREFHGGRCEIRTRGIWLRRPALYPTELIALVKALHNFQC